MNRSAANKSASSVSSGSYMPQTPAGTVLFELAAETEDNAWLNLIYYAGHMPYNTKDNLIRRGYKVLFWKVSHERL